MHPFSAVVGSVLQNFSAGKLRPIPSFILGRNGRVFSADELLKRFSLHELTLRMMELKLSYIDPSLYRKRLFQRVRIVMAKSRPNMASPFTKREMRALKLWSQTVLVGLDTFVYDTNADVHSYQQHRNFSFW